ncbi:mCG147471 [Mus musculus]|nr:mCG147471 [Mus musculus]
MLLTGLLIMACSACLLIEPRTPSHSLAQPIESWALSNQSLIKKMPYTFAYNPSNGGSFLVKIPSSQMILICVKLT